MIQNGLPSADTSAPPFATKDGLPTVKDGGSGKAAVPEDRPQSMARPEVVPSTGEQRPGGLVMLADPSGPSGDPRSLVAAAGAREVPFKNLK